MHVQSLSVCVPAGCPNNCKFCVAHMREEVYKNQIEGNKAFRDLYKHDFKRRLEFARDNGCNTVVLTGNGEPLMNRRFLEDFFEWNNSLARPFRWIDLQTSGVTLIDYNQPVGGPQPVLRWLRNAGLSTIALSLSSTISVENANYNGTPQNIKVHIVRVCEEIKRYDFNLRLSLNMTDAFDHLSGHDIFKQCKYLGANQVTFRMLYESGEDTEQDKWIREHKVASDVEESIINYIHKNGRRLERLPFGALRYAVDGMSVVVDRDCMSTEEENEVIRYLILRPDCKLYSKWDETGSLIF